MASAPRIIAANTAPEIITEFASDVVVGLSQPGQKELPSKYLYDEVGSGLFDVICLLRGEASLILEGAETRIRPGQVVIQRGTNHAWVAHGGPALFLAVLIDRPLAGVDKP